MRTSSLVSYNCASLLHIIKPCKKSKSLLVHPSSQSQISKHEVGCLLFPRNGSFQDLKRTSQAAPIEGRPNIRDFAVYCSHQPGDLFPFWHHGDSWMSWVLGLLAVVPLLTQRLLTLSKGAEDTAETVEKIAETVEKVAEDVEKVAEDVAENLPEGGKLRNVVAGVENVAAETAQNAQLVQDLMDKVEEKVEDDVESFFTNRTQEAKETVKDAKGEK